MTLTAAVHGELRYPRVRAAIGKALYWHYRLLRRQRHDRVVLERVGELSVLVLPSVLNPKLLRTGAFFASVLPGSLVRPGAQVLDMGSGSGVCALAVARQAAHVVAVDINPAAVRCVRINALLNGLEARIEVLHGDLFTPVSGRRFDVVLFNPPFIKAAPRDDADRAWRSADVAERFAQGLAASLAPGGCALLLLSTYGDAAQFVRPLEQHGFKLSVVATRAYINETLSLLRVVPAGDRARG